MKHQSLSNDQEETHNVRDPSCSPYFFNYNNLEISNFYCELYNYISISVHAAQNIKPDNMNAVDSSQFLSWKLNLN